MKYLKTTEGTSEVSELLLALFPTQHGGYRGSVEMHNPLQTLLSYVWINKMQTMWHLILTSEHLSVGACTPQLVIPEELTGVHF